VGSQIKGCDCPFRIVKERFVITKLVTLEANNNLFSGGVNRYHKKKLP
jgi:hypothetical protein